MKPDDLHATRARLRTGALHARDEIERSIAIAGTAACDAAWVRTTFGQARAQAQRPGIERSVLAGLAVSVKDLFDVEGEVTTAGSIVLEGAAPAVADCPAVARLRAAGGALLGRTQMVEFAFSGVGTNPHQGTPANPCDAATPRIPGGSSSGAAVTVASGAAFVGLGSDTGGSIRIPAALCGIVGFKSTARLVPTTGVLPLSTTLDTVCALTRSVRDAALVHEVLAARRVVPAAAAPSAWRFAVARGTTLHDALDAGVARAFERSLVQLSAAGAAIEEIALPQLDELATIQIGGGFAAAESFAWHRRLLADPARRARYDPRVRSRIERGAPMHAHDYIELLAARRDWIARMEAALAAYDAVLTPTVPIVAPPIAEVAPATGADAALDAARDAQFARVNALLLRNTSVVNMLDGCAISIPCHAPGELPAGLMLWHGALHDDGVLAAAAMAERSLSLA